MMDFKYSVPKPKYFALKKWTLVTILTISVVFLVISIFYADKWIEFFTKNAHYKVKPGQETLWNESASKITWIILCLISICFEFLFIYGIVKKNICLCTTCAVMAVIGTLFTVIQAISHPFLWANVIFGAVFSTVAILYVRDLKFMQRKMKESEHELHDGKTEKSPSCCTSCLVSIID